MVGVGVQVSGGSMQPTLNPAEYPALRPWFQDYIFVNKLAVRNFVFTRGDVVRPPRACISTGSSLFSLVLYETCHLFVLGRFMRVVGRS